MPPLEELFPSCQSCRTRWIETLAMSSRELRRSKRTRVTFSICAGLSTPDTPNLSMPRRRRFSPVTPTNRPSPFELARFFEGAALSQIVVSAMARSLIGSSAPETASQHNSHTVKKGVGLRAIEWSSKHKYTKQKRREVNFFALPNSTPPSLG